MSKPIEPLYSKDWWGVSEWAAYQDPQKVARKVNELVERFNQLEARLLDVADTEVKEGWPVPPKS